MTAMIADTSSPTALSWVSTLRFSALVMFPLFCNRSKSNAVWADRITSHQVGLASAYHA